MTEPAVTEPAVTEPVVTEPATTGSGSIRRTAIIGIIAVATFAAVLALLLGRITRIEIVVPKGTGNSMEQASGSSSRTPLIGARVSVDRGTVVTVVNNDDRFHILGPITVKAGARGSFTLDSTGTIAYQTTLRPDGTVTFIVK